MPKDIYASLKQGLVGCWIPSISGSGLTLPDLSQYGNHGSLVGMDASDWVSSGSGRALDFDGGNDYVPVKNTSIISKNFSNFSVSGWILWRSGESCIYSESETGGVRFILRVFSDGRIDAGVNDGNWHFVTTVNTITASKWNHITFTGSSSRLELFINGVSSANASWSNNFANVTFVTSEIARINNSGGLLYFSGHLDDIRLYNRALSASEIRLLASDRGIGFHPSKRLSNFSTRYAYKPPKPRSYGIIRNRDADTSSLKQGLVAAWCPSISGQGNVLPDLVGGNHGSLVSMGPEDWVSGQYGRALDFDGVNDAIDIGTSNTFNLVNEFTFALWLFQRGDGTIKTQVYISRRSTANNYPYGFMSGVGNVLRLFSNAGSDTSVFSDSGITLNKWHHVAVTRKGTAISFYIDGINVGNKTLLVGSSAPATFTSLGAQDFGSGIASVLDGQMSDVRIYNRALTEPEIKLLASKRGIGLEPRKPKITFTDLGVAKQFSQVRVKDSDTSTLRQGLVGAWCPSLPNGGSGNMLVDQSGYGNHGSLVNMAADDWVSSQYGRALDFDGSNDWVNVAAANSGALAIVGTGNCTISSWASNRGSASYRWILSNWNAAGVHFGMLSSSSRFGGYFVDTDEIQSDYSIPSDGSWHFYAATRTTGSIKLYVDGIERSIVSGTPTNKTGSFASSVITALGARNNNVIQLWDGQLDDIRIYNRALSESEIKLLASKRGIGLQNPQDDYLYYQFPSGSRRRRLLTGMP